MNRHLKRHLEMERLFGVDFLPLSRRAAEKTPRKSAPAKASAPAIRQTATEAIAAKFEWSEEYRVPENWRKRPDFRQVKCLPYRFVYDQWQSGEHPRQRCS